MYQLPDRSTKRVGFEISDRCLHCFGNSFIESLCFAVEGVGGPKWGWGIFSPTSRSMRFTRGTTPSERVQGTLRSLENATARGAAQPARRPTRILGVGNESEYVYDQKKAPKNSKTGKAMLQRASEVLGKMGGEIGEKAVDSERNDTIGKHGNAVKGQED